MDALYRNYLDTLFSLLDDKFGNQIWWTSMGEVASRVLPSSCSRRARQATGNPLAPGRPDAYCTSSPSQTRCSSDGQLVHERAWVRDLRSRVPGTRSRGVRTSRRVVVYPSR